MGRKRECALKCIYQCDFTAGNLDGKHSAVIYLVDLLGAIVICVLYTITYAMLTVNCTGEMFLNMYLITRCVTIYLFRR